jgi:hypothetical protein
VPGRGLASRRYVDGGRNPLPAAYLTTGGSAPLNKEPRRNVYPLNLDDASANWGQGCPRTPGDSWPWSTTASAL